MGVGFQPVSICSLQFLLLGIFRLVRIGRETPVEEEIPDFFPSVASVERFVLGVADPAELIVRCRRLGAVTFANQLYQAFAGVDPPTQHGSQITRFGAEDFLPIRFVAQEGKRIRYLLPGTSQLAANGGDEDYRSWRHAGSLPEAFKFNSKNALDHDPLRDLSSLVCL